MKWNKYDKLKQILLSHHKSTEIMKMNESLELDVHRAGIRQSPVFTGISPQTECDFLALRNEKGYMKMTKLLYFWYY